MRTKFIAFTIVVLALVLSACGTTSLSQAAQPNVRTLNVNGAGQVSLTPDVAYINIGVHSQAATATEAVTTNKTQTAAVIAAIKDAKVADKDINTTNFSIYPSQQFAADGTASGTLYMVDNTVYVVVHDLGSLGDLIDSAVNAGANTINSIQFDVADKKDALKQARAKAVEDAKSQAQELADAAGIKLGDIQSISFYDNSPVPMLAGKGGGGGAAYDAAAAVPIQPGQLSISVSVSINYEIK